MTFRKLQYFQLVEKTLLFSNAFQNSQFVVLPLFLYEHTHIRFTKSSRLYYNNIHSVLDVYRVVSSPHTRTPIKSRNLYLVIQLRILIRYTFLFFHLFLFRPIRFTFEHCQRFIRKQRVFLLKRIRDEPVTRVERLRAY